jgi:hypothetical protein
MPERVNDTYTDTPGAALGGPRECVEQATLLRGGL